MNLKAIITLVSAATLISTCSGCQVLNGRSARKKIPLPADVAGVWRAREGDWAIALDLNATVSWFLFPTGKVNVRPNRTTTVEMKDGQKSTFTGGDCIVDYAPTTRELYVSLEMKNIHIAYLHNVVDGNSVDRFVGPVSEDGKVWTTDWIKMFDYGPRFPWDANDIFAEPLIFDKIED